MQPLDILPCRDGCFFRIRILPIKWKRFMKTDLSLCVHVDDGACQKACLLPLVSMCVVLVSDERLCLVPLHLIKHIGRG